MLQEAFRNYIISGMLPREAGILARAMADCSFVEEGTLLTQYSEAGPGHYAFEAQGGVLRGAFVGPRPPPSDPGDWWMDSCDLSLNILLPQHVDPEDEDSLSPEARKRIEDNKTWFPMRPVLRYQIGTFLDVAQIDRLEFATTMLDASRLLRGNELLPITDISTAEASLYLTWANKYFATDAEWLSINTYFKMSPWSLIPREWAGGSQVNDAYCVAISEATLMIDPMDTESDPDLSKQMLFNLHDKRPDITFRATLPLAYGFQDEPRPYRHSKTGVRLGQRLPRPLSIP
jgi:hypothetical protein